MHPRRFGTPLMLLLAALFVTCSADRNSYGEDSRAIRGAARRILSSREFRNLKPVKRSGAGPKIRGSDGKGGGGKGNQNGKGEQGDGRFEDGRFNEDPEFFGDQDDDWQPGGNDDPADSETPDNDSSSIDTPSSAGPIGQAILGVIQVIVMIAVAIAAGLMIYQIVKGIMQSRNRAIPDTPDTEPDSIGGVEPETAPGELPADVYVAKAQELAAAGKYREAVAQLLLGAMSQIERAGLIKYRRGLTHRDYARAVRSHRSMYQSMKAMVRVYEPLGFGRREPTQEHFEKSLSGYQAGFRATHPPQ